MTDTTLPSPEAARRVPRWLIAALTIGAFLLIDTFHMQVFRQIVGDLQGYPRLAALATIGYGPHFLVPLALGAGFFGARHALGALGLDRPILTGLAVALAGTLILPIGYALTGALSLSSETPLAVLRGSVLPGVGEEVFYRAFFFGFLFRFARWGFLPAALLGAVFFGAGHLYQGKDLMEGAGIFALTAAGALWFSWLYAEWRWNIWVPIGFHVLMNLWWEVFSVADNALGSWTSVGLRLGVIVLSIVITVIAARRRGDRRRVTGRAWFWGGPAGPRAAD